MKLGRLILGACALAVVGCGTTTRYVTQMQTVTRTVTVPRTASAPKPAASAAPVPSATGQPAAASTRGLTVHDFNGDTLAVKADGFIDPANPSNQDVSPATGTRFVAVEVTLTDEGPGTISSDANTNMTLIGSDGQAYTSQFEPVSECTNFSNGAYTLLNGNAERGCVVFQLPAGVSLKAVQFSLGNGTVQFNNR